jgi:ribose 5-phosphate isomerase B
MILIASDHAGFPLKEQLKEWLASEKTGIDSLDSVTRERKFLDLGCNSLDSTDYPDFAKVLASELLCYTKSLEADSNREASPKLQDFGILICGSGQGMCMQANRFPGIRAALVYDEDSARLSRAHNNANVICLGARKTSIEEANHFVRIFANSNFEGGRHQIRVLKLDAPLQTPLKNTY